MYERGLSGLGFALPKWLTPPRSVRELATQIAGAVVRGTTVSVPTPMGTKTFDLGNPQDVATLKALASGALDYAKGVRVNVGGNKPPSLLDQGNELVSRIPGGLGTVLLVLAGVVLVARRR